jgi:hypothetical protein
MHATRAAVEEGVVPGGGVALIRGLAAVSKLKGDNEHQNHGIQIAKRAMEAPLREIVANAGEEPSVVLNKVADGKGNYGYNAATAAIRDSHSSGSRIHGRPGFIHAGPKPSSASRPTTGEPSAPWMRCWQRPRPWGNAGFKD